MRPPKKAALPPAAQLLDMMEGGISRAELAAKFGVAETTITVRISDSGIREQRERERQRLELRARLADPWRPPEWMDQAECRNTLDPDAFFPENGPAPDWALEMCARCPVRAECLEYAHQNLEQHGLWGGLGARRRAIIRTRQRRAEVA